MSGWVRPWAVAAVFFAASEAWAFECTVARREGDTSNGRVLFTQAWNQRCIPYFISRKGTLISSDKMRQLIASSFSRWSSNENACTDLNFVDSGYTDEGARIDAAKPDANINVIVSIEDVADAAVFNGQSLLAVTQTSFSRSTGEIFDSDILFNTMEFDFQDLQSGTTCTGRERFDFQNTLVHEIGHFIGFEHQASSESTMFAAAIACETKKRDLASDDSRGVCSVYPKDLATNSCTPPPMGYDVGNVSVLRGQCDRVAGKGDGGCTSTPGSVSALLLVLAGFWTAARGRTSRKENS